MMWNPGGNQGQAVKALMDHLRGHPKLMPPAGRPMRSWLLPPQPLLSCHASSATSYAA